MENIHKIKIKTTTLDEELINEKRVDLIKIDVEGGEFAVLKGSEKIINKFHPVIIFEHGLHHQLIFIKLILIKYLIFLILMTMIFSH